MKGIISRIGFKLMTLVYKIRDIFLPHHEILKEAGLKPGLQVVDYGCGPGGYISTASDIVGKSGKVYAVDMNTLAIQRVNNLISKKHLINVVTIVTDCSMNIPGNSIDIVYLFDFFHELKNPNPIIEEIYRVLKKNGIFSIFDPIIKKSEIIYTITNKNLFELFSESTKIINFRKLD